MRPNSNLLPLRESLTASVIELEYNFINIILIYYSKPAKCEHLPWILQQLRAKLSYIFYIHSYRTEEKPLNFWKELKNNISIPDKGFIPYTSNIYVRA